MRTRSQPVRKAVAWGAAWIVLASMLCSPASLAAAAGTCDGVSMPSTIQVAGKTLVRNGMGVRRATFLNVHVYVAALYVEKPSRSAAVLLRGDQIRSLTLRFVRDVDRDEMGDALEEGVKNNAPQKVAAMRPEMERLKRMLPPLRTGNALTFHHVPGAGLSVLAGQKTLGTIANDEFASVLFRVWLGSEPADEGLKAGLLGGKCD